MTRSEIVLEQAARELDAFRVNFVRDNCRSSHDTIAFACAMAEQAGIIFVAVCGRETAVRQFRLMADDLARPV